MVELIKHKVLRKAKQSSYFFLLIFHMKQIFSKEFHLVAVTNEKGSCAENWDDQQWWKNFRMRRVIFLDICAVLTPEHLQMSFLCHKESCCHHYMAASTATSK